MVQASPGHGRGLEVGVAYRQGLAVVGAQKEGAYVLAPIALGHQVPDGDDAGLF